MPISQLLNPQKLRAEGVLSFRDIPLNAYRKTLRDVKGEFPEKDLHDIFYDMRLIREFETMLYSIRLTKVYHDIEYSYTGPAHLSTGQEASSVGQAYVLDVNDFIFGTHRSHGEVIAKGMSAIRKLGDDALLQIMKDFKGGTMLRKVEQFSKNTSSVQDLAADFLLYGFITELFGREIGFTGGLGNSMHMFFTPFGIYPNNAIVGASGGIGAGAALYKKMENQDGIVVVNSGDGSLSTGHAWEAINFAAMQQFTELWDDAYKGGLPILFNYMNNAYAMSGQTCGETMGYEILARVGAAFNADQLHSERVDGYNPFAVIDAIRRKKDILVKGKGPVLLDTITYRHGGHSVTDQFAYRSKDEMDLWMQQDSIAFYKKEMIEAGLSTETAVQSVEQSIQERILHIVRYATDLEFSPRMNFFQDPDAIARCMFSNGYVEKMAERAPEVIGDGGCARQPRGRFPRRATTEIPLPRTHLPARRAATVSPAAASGPRKPRCSPATPSP